MYETIVPISRGPGIKNQAVYHPNTPCNGYNGSFFGYVTLDPLPYPQGKSLELTGPITNSYRNFPISGKWRDIVKSRVIKMTPGSAYKSQEEFFLASFTRNTYNRVVSGGYDICNGVDYVRDIVEVNRDVSWTEQGDFRYWSKKYPNAPTINFAEVDGFEKSIKRLQVDAWKELIQTYDLGTELAELHKTLQFGIGILQKVRHPLQTIADLREAKKYKEAASAWMQYRYAIMPLIYSAQDIAKLIKEKDNVFKTVRRRVNQQFLAPNIPVVTCFYTIRTGDVRANITCKGRWEASALHTLGHVGLNPIQVAWELTTLSFVVDWFVNFGDYLTAVSSTWSSMASQLEGCTSVRGSYTDHTFIRIVDDQRDYFRQVGQNGLVFIDKTVGEFVVRDLLLKTKKVDSYDRYLFNQKDLEIVFSPFLNWKRLIDGSILSISFLQKALRKLR